MLDSDVVIQPMHFVPGDVKRKSLQPGTLQQEDTVINMLNDQTPYLCEVAWSHGILTSRWWRWCWLAILFLSYPFLHNVTSADKLKKQTCADIYKCSVDYSACCRWRENRKVFVSCLGYKLSSAPVPCAGCSGQPNALQHANGSLPSVCDARRCSIYSRTSSPGGGGTNAELELKENGNVA